MAFVVRKVGSVLSEQNVMDYVAKQVLLDKTDMSIIILQFTFTKSML